MPSKKNFVFTQNMKQRIAAALNNKQLSEMLARQWEDSAPENTGLNGGYEFTAGFKGKTTVSTDLFMPINASVDAVTLDSSAGFNPSGGRAIIGGVEIVEYGGVVGNQLTGVSRGALGSDAVEHSSGSRVSNASYAWEGAGGIEYTQDMVDAGAWMKLELDYEVHLSSDIPYWTTPTPLPHVGLGVFGGQHLPYGVSGLYDFSFNDWEDGSIGTLDFSKCRTGDLLMCRFDFEVIPQIANTTIETGLTFATRNPETLDVTFEFPLTTTPLFYGAGTVGKVYLNRPMISAYFASEEDVHAIALPSIKADNPVIIRPKSLLTTIIR